METRRAPTPYASVQPGLDGIVTPDEQPHHNLGWVSHDVPLSVTELSGDQPAVL